MEATLRTTKDRNRTDLLNTGNTEHLKTTMRTTSLSNDHTPNTHRIRHRTRAKRILTILHNNARNIRKRINTRVLDRCLRRRVPWSRAVL